MNKKEKQPIYDVSRWDKKKGDTVKFTCKCQIEKIDSRQAENGNLYWVVTSTNKIRFVCFNGNLFEQLKSIGQEQVSIRGKLNFVMGSTYLLITEILTLSLQIASIEQDFFDVIPQGNEQPNGNEQDQSVC